MNKLVIFIFSLVVSLCIAVPVFASINDKVSFDITAPDTTSNTATEPLLLAGGGRGGRGGGNQGGMGQGQGGNNDGDGDGDGDGDNNQNNDGDGDRGD